MNKKNRNNYELKKNLKDTFGAYLLDGAVFDGYYDFPVINVHLNREPKALIPYSKLVSTTIEPGSFCHFYEFDYIFDGRDGVWNSLIQGNEFKRGFNFNKIKNLQGVVSPDYSLYMDMPRCMQIWNIYRSRTVCYYLNKRGMLCIPNVRWTDEESYKFAFDGIEKGCAVSVGTLGCSKNSYDKQLFIDGFKEMIIKIQPSAVIIYGSINADLTKMLEENKQKFYFFPSQTSKAFKEKCHGNES